MTQHYTVIVVGAGHAGCEAALAAARLGAQTALITMDTSGPARMSCNPSIGGLGKSHIVAEVDALGGEIGRNADYTAIQVRTLNTKKGAAVRATRIQCDRTAYSARMQAVLAATPNLTILAAEVVDLQITNGSVSGVVTGDGGTIGAEAVVLTPGTFLHGLIHVGQECHEGGRIGESAAIRLAEGLQRLGFAMGRLKTGTPPRIDSQSIDFASMERQDGDIPPPFFTAEALKEWQLFHVEQSRNSRISAQAISAVRPWIPGARQLPCYLTHTTPETHEIIRANLKRSALYGGRISGTGVRYCPSLEDKIVKFPEKPRHHIFIEPDGLDAAVVYPNGLSNSMPADVQREIVHSIPGLEKAVLTTLAYAIEYDFVQPTQLDHSLCAKSLPGLYLAGQICGTTGYEEAAGQGFVAGVNAALRVAGKPPFRLGRHEAYLGVMIDDLVTKGTDEPYRMFTSRAEYRLVLRQDNARLRLLDRAGEVGIISKEQMSQVAQMLGEIAGEVVRLRETRHGGHSLLQLLQQAGATYECLPGRRAHLSDDVIAQVEIEARYDGYIATERRRIDRDRELDDLALPAAMDYGSLKVLSFEAREKLARIRPDSLGQAARIPGIRAVDISILAALLRR